MAVIDSLNVFAGSFGATGAVTYQAMSGTDTTVLGGNVFDTTGGSPTGQNIDLGKGEELNVVFQVGTSYSGGTSVEYQFVSADDTALGTNLTVLGSAGAIPVASLTAGKQINLVVPKADPRAIRRYVGIRAVTVGATTAGTVFASIQRQPGDLPQPNYKSGFTVA